MILSGPTWAVVPVKPFHLAKQRLARTFSPSERRTLAEAMFDDVLAVLTRVESLAGVLVVTRDSRAAARARQRGAFVLREPGSADLSAAVAMAASHLSMVGCAAMLAVHGDVPGVTVDEVRRLIGTRHHERSFTIVPAHDGGGSNAVLSSPPQAVPLYFGENSCERNLAAARAAGLEPELLRLPGIALDLDHPRDVRVYMAQAQAPRTRSGRWLLARQAARADSLCLEAEAG